MVSWKQRNSSRKRSKRRSSNRRFANLQRIDILRISFIGVGVIIGIRLFNVQVLQHGDYEKLASASHQLYEELVPERGEIYVQDKYSDDGLYVIATNKTLAEVHAEPIHISDPEDTAEKLAPLLNIPKDDLFERLNKPEDPDEILKRRVPEEVVEAIERLELPGIKFRQEDWRYYSEAETTAHITGYYGYSEDDRKGQYGIEGYFEEDLRGEAGFLRGEKDAFGRFLTIGDSLIDEAIDGNDYILTVDKNVQFQACNSLEAAVTKYGAKGGTVIIMHPDTGAILALCNAPSYDPNRYNEVEEIEVFKNSAISDVYEPGSVMKTMTMAAGIDLGVISADSTYVDEGVVNIAGYPIRNSDGKAHGLQDMTFVLSESLNTGTIHIVQQTGNESFLYYLKAFGFGSATNIELSGEQIGDLSGVEQLRDIYSATASYGQGLTVTPLQLTAAYAAIANDGTLMKPYIIDKEILPNGEVLATEPEVVTQVIRPDTAKVVGAMLVNVIDSGHAKKAALPGYFMAGKTGTAQLVNENGVYDASRHNDTFIGYGPITDPQFVMLTHLKEPANVPWSADSAAPLWGEIAQYLVNYYQIKPDRE